LSPRTKTTVPKAAKPSAELRRRAREIAKRLKRAYPDAQCALVHENPLQLLVATILSAQCTDARVNMVTPKLFARFPTAAALAGADRPELEEIVKTTGFFRNKAKSIHGAASTIVSDFGGAVPRTMEELLTLPGVARKTANVVLGTAFSVADGFVVDTHVFRLTHRMGLAEGKTPAEVERELMEIFPREDWIALAHILIHHGRAVCSAKSPDCERCVVNDWCPKIGVKAKTARAKPAERPKRPLKERIAASRKTRKKKKR
jgi:endonuclease-3